MKEKAIRTAGPATHPNWAIAQANESTPEPMTAVIICALAVINVPKNTFIQELSFVFTVKNQFFNKLFKKSVKEKVCTWSFFSAIIVVEVFGITIFYGRWIFLDVHGIHDLAN